MYLVNSKNIIMRFIRILHKPYTFELRFYLKLDWTSKQRIQVFSRRLKNIQIKILYLMCKMILIICESHFNVIGMIIEESYHE